jgi:hypothetical protein
MKTHFRKWLPVVLSCIFSSSLSAQEMIRQESCDIKSYLAEIDSLKTFFSSKGFIVLKEASMTMESAYEMPIVVPMTQGALYEFVFIGDPSSRLYEVRMYDWDEKQVVYKKNNWGDVDGNIISYAYIPQFSEYHMIKPVQVNKSKKKLCGYVMLLKKVK